MRKKKKKRREQRGTEHNLLNHCALRERGVRGGWSRSVD